MIKANQSNFGAPGETRTHNRPLRRRVLYPVELLARKRVILPIYLSLVYRTREIL